MVKADYIQLLTDAFNDCIVLCSEHSGIATFTIQTQDTTLVECWEWQIESEEQTTIMLKTIIHNLLRTGVDCRQLINVDKTKN